MDKHKVFEDYLNKIDEPSHRDRVESFLNWIMEEFPDLVPVVKWNQPMFTHHDTYIFGMSTSKKHIAVSPEVATIKHFEEDIKASGYGYTDNIIRILWNEEIQYPLIKKMIEFQIEDKANYDKFWR
ncbi:MAG: DUF1801 domain-containing protein [Gemella sp.]|nr:DUF1801 domain-containing protein [Gemella sp.]